MKPLTGKLRLAIPHWDGRIASVFDTARQMRIIDVDDGRKNGESEVALHGFPFQNATELNELGVDLLICGAVSRPLHEMIVSSGIEVIPFVAGGLSDVVGAWLRGEISRGAYFMPGCRHPGRRRWMETTLNRKGGMMNQERGQGRNRNTGGRMRGRKGGPKAAGPTGFCVCLNCGHRETHQRGMPCMERVCPKCGSPMTRE